MDKKHVALIALAILFVALPGKVSAAAGPAKGLLISPTQQFLYVDAGKTLQSSFTVTNLTDQPLPVQFGIKQFSVADYSYTYEFVPPPNNWLNLDTSAATLPAHQSMAVSYHIAVPPRTAPGGRYYTLLASATMRGSGGVSSTIQAADLLYLTVNGQLLTSSKLVSSSIQRFAWGNAFTFKLAPENIGNVYTNVNVHGSLAGIFTRPEQSGDTHILIPSKPRALTGTIPTPLLPGVYHATYGYTTSSNWVIDQQAWVVFVPPWSVALLIILIILAPKLRRLYKSVRRVRRSSVEGDSGIDDTD